jgi:protein-S-isoprenylcysteine O-methyltransferase Ste14
LDAYHLFLSLFTVSEVSLLVSRRSKKAKVKNQQDNQSLLYLWIIITGSMLSGYIIARQQIWMSGSAPLIEILGIALVIAGFIFRWVAIIQLGAMFTVDVSISNNHTLKIDGLYKIVRHPTYWGLILIIFGLGVLTDSVLACIVMVIPIFLAINYRITVEEKSLINEFGSQYLDYKSRVKKIIPFLY